MLTEEDDVEIYALAARGWSVSAISRHTGRDRKTVSKHLAAAMQQVLVALGGTARVWRTDRMATIVTPQTGRITSDAAALAKHYGVQVAVCPARRAQRKGVVEKAIQYMTRSWWRTAAVATLGDAQRGLDAWSVRVADQRTRRAGTVAEIAAAELLRALPAAAYPAQIVVERKASRAALVAFEGNRYSVAPAHAGRTVTVTWRISEAMLRIMSAHGEVIAEHRRVAAGAGQTVRCAEHAAMLQTAVLAAFTTKDACRRKPNLPPGDNALAELA